MYLTTTPYWTKGSPQSVEQLQSSLIDLLLQQQVDALTDSQAALVLMRLHVETHAMAGVRMPGGGWAGAALAPWGGVDDGGYVDSDRARYGGFVCGMWWDVCGMCVFLCVGCVCFQIVVWPIFSNPVPPKTTVLTPCCAPPSSAPRSLPHCPSPPNSIIMPPITILSQHHPKRHPNVRAGVQTSPLCNVPTVALWIHLCGARHLMVLV